MERCDGSAADGTSKLHVFSVLHWGRREQPGHLEASVGPDPSFPRAQRGVTAASPSTEPKWAISRLMFLIPRRPLFVPAPRGRLPSAAPVLPAGEHTCSGVIWKLGLLAPGLAGPVTSQGRWAPGAPHTTSKPRLLLLGTGRFIQSFCFRYRNFQN